jgi:hypothetical protein
MKRLTREHIDRIAKTALPGLLQRAASASDLIRLVEIERRLVPRKITARTIIWEDYLD